MPAGTEGNGRRETDGGPARAVRRPHGPVRITHLRIQL